MGKKKQRDPPPKFSTGGTWHTHHVIFFDDLLNSPAYIALSAHAKETYTILMQEYKGKYSGPTIICPYSTFKEKGMRPNTLSRALLQLECYGFIKIEHGGLEHQPNKYTFLDKWKESYDQAKLDAFKEKFKEALKRKELAKELKNDVS